LADIIKCELRIGQKAQYILSISSSFSHITSYRSLPLCLVSSTPVRSLLLLFLTTTHEHPPIHLPSIWTASDTAGLNDPGIQLPTRLTYSAFHSASLTSRLGLIVELEISSAVPELPNSIQHLSDLHNNRSQSWTSLHTTSCTPPCPFRSCTATTSRNLSTFIILSAAYLICIFPTQISRFISPPGRSFLDALHSG